MLQLSVTGVSYQQQETPQSLRRAIMLLQDRLQELEALVGGSTASSTAAPHVNGRHTDDTPPTLHATPLAAESTPQNRRVHVAAGLVPQKVGVGAGDTASPRGGVAVSGRWFEERWPKITLRSGEVSIPRSVDELKALLEKQGLRPHKRGDASMLLWQVKARLGLNVEPVSRPPE